jgi:hypothetical protein
LVQGLDGPPEPNLNKHICTTNVFKTEAAMPSSVVNGAARGAAAPARSRRRLIIVTARRRPSRQNRECFAAGPAQPAPNADDIVDLVVGLFSPLPMANDGLVAAQRTPPRQHPQWERRHPGSILSSASGSAIKRITAGVKAAADRLCQVSISWTGLHPPAKSVSNEKRILPPPVRRHPHPPDWPV